jgi:hypothetical protein
MSSLNLDYLEKIPMNVDCDPCDTSFLDQILRNIVYTQSNVLVTAFIQP